LANLKNLTYLAVQLRFIFEKDDFRIVRVSVLPREFYSELSRPHQEDQFGEEVLFQSVLAKRPHYINVVDQDVDPVYVGHVVEPDGLSDVPVQHHAYQSKKTDEIQSVQTKNPTQ
jgi:hypothetical protein